MTSSPDTKFDLRKKIDECQQEIDKKEAQILKILDSRDPISEVIVNSPRLYSVDLKSEVGVDYSQLQKLLSEGKWKENVTHRSTILMSYLSRFRCVTRSPTHPTGPLETGFLADNQVEK